jgi:hypothetical protein
LNRVMAQIISGPTLKSNPAAAKHGFLRGAIVSRRFAPRYTNYHY